MTSASPVPCAERLVACSRLLRTSTLAARTPRRRRCTGRTRPGAGVAGHGSITLSASANLAGLVDITADGYVETAKPQLVVPGLDLSYGVRVLYADLTDEQDGACVIEVQDMDGNRIVSGVGESAGAALASVFEYMLPPTSDEYLPPDDGMPDPTTGTS